MTGVRAHVGLGCNLGDRLETLTAALFAMEDVDGITVADVSGVYETEPWGGVDQPSFYNAVAVLDTTLSPHELLAELQLLEAIFGRDRDAEQRWGPRPLDLDVLTYGDQTIDTEDLVVPHPRLTERAFVLVPLMEVWPGAVLPDGTRLTSALTALAPIDGIDLVVRLSDVPGAGGLVRPEGPRAPAAILAEDWQREQGNA